MDENIKQCPGLFGLQLTSFNGFSQLLRRRQFNSFLQGCQLAPLRGCVSWSCDGLKANEVRFPTVVGLVGLDYEGLTTFLSKVVVGL